MRKLRERACGLTFRLACPVLAGVLAAAGQGKPAPLSRSSGASHIVAPSSSYHFPSEKYVYSVRWQLFNAGTSTVQIEASGAGVHVTATADSAGVPNTIYPVHDIFAAEVDPASFCTLEITKHNAEGPHRRDISISFDYGRGKGRIETKDLKISQSKQDQFDIPPCVTDVISGFFYVASLPLAPGFSQTFPINDNGRTSDISLAVEARETVKVAAGVFPSLRVKAQPVAGPMQGKGVLWIWFSDDRRHIPVEMKSKLGFATLLFHLQRIEPGVATRP
ncbi:MAG: DUF3108 domain-containing protein [Acidobacteria bacterium]|nr:DUF3108 domain-containing protein [Acidobacteriota bacterium]